MNQLLLDDVFHPVKVPDNSFVFFTLSTIVCVIVVLTVYYLYKKRVKKNKKDDAYYLHILLNRNFYNVKQSAYLFSYYGRKLAKTKEQKKSVEKIISQLFIYKYRQKSLCIPQALQKEMKNFVDALRDFYA
ncbi:hypothetical protein [Sulfurimonas sp.]